MTPAGWKRGAVVGRLHGRLAEHIERHRLGMIFGAETGFLIASHPDTVRAPDIAFIRQEHVSINLPEESFWPGAPDLAVEVLSPGDSLKDVNEKVKSWLQAGAELVWVINPVRCTIAVHDSSGGVFTLGETDELTGGDVLLGFRCLVRDIFFQT